MTETLRHPAVIKVTLIEDRREIREGLAMLIGGTEASLRRQLPLDGGGARQNQFRASRHRALRHRAPGMSGIEGMRLLKERTRTCYFKLTVSTPTSALRRLVRWRVRHLLKKTPRRVCSKACGKLSGAARRCRPSRAARDRIFRDIRPPERADYDLTPHETRLLKL